ncbi:MAG: hypothetical protein JNM68_16455 [Dinghuibacter sp.]|nr:hypothetical protein [Dinghuibacter sp.]
MNITKVLTAAGLVLAIGFVSCKKGETIEEFETTFELSGNQAVSENLVEDAHDLLDEATANANLMGARPGEALQSMNNLSCATVTITPASGFPKNIVIDFGAGCVSQNGVVRKGKINVVLSDSVRRPGSTAVMTFDNYFVNGFKKEGTITWTNTSSGATKSWSRKVENGKITAPDGRYWLHSGLKNVVQTAGASTPLNLLDDVFSITGNHTVTNAAGNSRTATITEALQKKTVCENIDKGKVKIEGASHYAIIDFGDGTCDRVATISIDGRAPRTILLR